MKLNRTPNELDRNSRNKENDNWGIIEGELRKVGDVVDDFIGTVTDEVVGELVDKAKLSWKEPVDSLSDLPVDADTGETRMTKDDGKVYRFDGTNWVEIQQIDAGPVNELDSRLSGLYSNLVQYESKKYYIPSDFNDLQEGVDALSKKKVMNGTSLELVFESGHKVTSGAYLEGGDYSFIKISSEDEILEVSDEFSGNFLHCVNAKSPVFNILLDMINKGTDGIRLEDSSSCVVNSGKGVTRAGGTCLFARTSNVRGGYSVFSRGNNRNVWLTRASVASLAESDLSYCAGGEVAVYVSRGSILDASGSNISFSNASSSAVQCLRSKVTLLDADVSNSARDGIYASQAGEVSARNTNLSGCVRHAVFADYSSTIDLRLDSDVSNAGGYGILADNTSRISAVDLKADNCVSGGVRAINGSTISIIRADVSNSNGYGVVAENLGAINCPELTADNCKNYGIFANETSTIHALRASVKSCNNTAVFATKNSSINVSSSDIRDSIGISVEANNMSRVEANSVIINNSGGYGVSSVGGSSVSIRGATILNSTHNDLHVNHGGIMQSSLTKTTNGGSGLDVGDTNVPKLNEISYRGIIFRNA